jgi:methylmalonyl-CoA/ethylmalonyl-CoA epimerase
MSRPTGWVEDRTVIRRIHHVGIVVTRLDDAYRFYRDVLGLPLVKEAEVPDQGIRAALLSAGESEIELLEPVAADTGVARFLDRRGEGLHHLCFDTRDVSASLTDLAQRGVEVIDRVPRDGLAGRIAFLHPRACDGVLVELATPPVHDGERVSHSVLRLKRLVIGAREPMQAAARFQELFGLPEVKINGGPRTMLGAGRGALLFVPAAEVGEHEGLVALSLMSEAFTELARSVERAGVKAMHGRGEVTIDPASSHGVHLHISRYD